MARVNSLVQRFRPAAVVTCALAVLLGAWLLRPRAPQAAQAPLPATPISDRAWWDMVVAFSEEGQAFRSTGAIRTDNLISNETSFARVIPALRANAHGGAYLGVGPEQNFNYITALQPAIAFIIDIRRDNMLLHLMYKAVAETSADRAEFLSSLFGRPRPAGLDRETSAKALFTAFRRAPGCTRARAVESLHAVLTRLEAVHGLTLSSTDEASIKNAVDSFCDGGPDMQWDTSGDPWIPSYSDLMAEADSHGQGQSYLASDATFQIFKRYEMENRIVPIVGDFSGAKALRAVGGYLKAQHITVAAFYMSNVETYLGFTGEQRFVANVTAMPTDSRSLVIHTNFQITGMQRGRPFYETSVSTGSLEHWEGR